MKNTPKSWNCLWKQPCFVMCRITSAGKLTANPTFANQSMHVSWELTNLRESVWKELCRNIMRDRSAGQGFNSLSHHHLVRMFIPLLEAMKILDANAAVDKEWAELEKCHHGQ